LVERAGPQPGAREPDLAALPHPAAVQAGPLLDHRLEDVGRAGERAELEEVDGESPVAERTPERVLVVGDLALQPPAGLAVAPDRAQVQRPDGRVLDRRDAQPGRERDPE